VKESIGTPIIVAIIVVVLCVVGFIAFKMFGPGSAGGGAATNPYGPGHQQYQAPTGSSGYGGAAGSGGRPGSGGPMSGGPGSGGPSSGGPSSGGPH